MAAAVGKDEYFPAAVPQIRQPDLEALPANAFAQKFRPFDGRRRLAIGEHFIEAKALELAGIVETVEIEMIENQAAGVFGMQGEGGAGDPKIGGNAQTAGEALGEAGLAGTQVTRQQNNFAALALASQGGGDVPRGVGRRGNEVVCRCFVRYHSCS